MTTVMLAGDVSEKIEVEHIPHKWDMLILPEPDRRVLLVNQVHHIMGKRGIQITLVVQVIRADT